MGISRREYQFSLDLGEVNSKCGCPISPRFWEKWGFHSIDVLRKLQIKRINFLRTDISRKQRHLARPKRAPRSRAELPMKQSRLLQVRNLLHFSIADAHTIVSSLLVQEGIEVDVSAVARPRQIPKRPVQRHLTPLLGLHVVKLQLPVSY